MSRRFDDLVALQARLLAPGGCPWDREQTHQSLRTYLLEETYEVLEQLDAHNFEKLPDELGDLLLQVVFHSALAQQAGHFEIGDVIERIHTKLVRRHPHVFGDTRADTAGQVVKNWEQLKAEERKAAGHAEADEAKSLMSGVTKGLPATLEAFQLTRRAARIGFDWESIEGVLDKLAEEIRELRDELGKARAHAGVPPSAEQQVRIEAELGDLLFAAVNAARFLHADPELALRAANRKFVARFQQMELAAEKQGKRLADLPRDEMEALWDRAKAAEAGNT